MKFVDASWYLGGNRVGSEEFLEKRIPDAVHFDIDEVSNVSSGLPHMLPSESQFSTACANLGIENDDTLVVYGGENCFSAPRCWWTFRAFGHEKVHVLNGGITAWQNLGGAVESGLPLKPAPTTTAYCARLDPSLVASWEDLLGACSDSTSRIIDARSIARFHGEAPEPRPGLQGGHIPGSSCIPFTDLLVDGDLSSFNPVDELRKTFENAGVGPEDPVYTTCGSGVTAAVLSFALEVSFGRIAPVYDGSWSEWGARSDLPKDTR